MKNIFLFLVLQEVLSFGEKICGFDFASTPTVTEQYAHRFYTCYFQSYPKNSLPYYPALADQQMDVIIPREMIISFLRTN